MESELVEIFEILENKTITSHVEITQGQKVIDKDKFLSSHKSVILRQESRSVSTKGRERQCSLHKDRALMFYNKLY